MKIHILITAIWFVHMMAGCYADNGHADLFERYNVVWNTQATSSKESMPLSGSNGFGSNVWVEKGIIHLYLASNNSYDENGNLLKLGAATIELIPNPFRDGMEFSQKLDLYNGRIIISGKEKNGLTAHVELWYDNMYNSVHVDVIASDPVKLFSSYASWRDRDKMVNLSSWNHKEASYITKADVVEVENNSVIFFHKNENADSITDSMLKNQHLLPYKVDLVNPAKDLVFGGILQGTSQQYTGVVSASIDRWKGTQWVLESKLEKKHSVVITPLVKNRVTVEAWKAELMQHSEKALSHSEKLKEESKCSWNSFWEKSYIVINPDKPESDPGFQIGRNYQLFRYMLACNRGNNLPLKFNGGIFTFDPMRDDEIRHKPNGYGVVNTSPDFRNWGNLFMSQNQRLIGWPALSSGDYELVEPSLKFYADRLKMAENRSKQYWDHNGAAFMEALSLYGLPVDALATSTGEASAGHLKHHFSMQMEFAYMALLWGKYSGEDINPYMPFIESVVTFYDEHYRMERKKAGLPEYDENGRLVLYPMNSLELYSDATNPVECVAGLRSIIMEILTLPNNMLGMEKRLKYQRLYERLPEIGFEMYNHKKVIKPAEKHDREWNEWEYPEMYVVWPYSLIRKGKQGFDEALNTWQNLPESRSRLAHQFWSWQCTPVYAAMLGEATDAKRLMIEKLSDKNANVKFSAFFGPGHDWIPDFNWGGSGMVGLQKMLFDSDKDSVYVFSAWPREWNVQFKLHGYDQTVVVGEYTNGTLERLEISCDTEKEVWNGLHNK